RAGLPQPSWSPQGATWRGRVAYLSISGVGWPTAFGCRAHTGATSSGRGTPSAWAMPWSVEILAATRPASISMIVLRWTPVASARRAIDHPRSLRWRATWTPSARRSGVGAGIPSSVRRALILHSHLNAPIRGNVGRDKSSAAGTVGVRLAALIEEMIMRTTATRTTTRRAALGGVVAAALLLTSACGSDSDEAAPAAPEGQSEQTASSSASDSEIGRASCRERVWAGAGDEAGPEAREAE